MPRIVEFATDICVAHGHAGPGLKYEFQGKISVDLDWVASAQPYGEWTEIGMAGGPARRAIEISYPDFMNMWRPKA